MLVISLPNDLTGRYVNFFRKENLKKKHEPEGIMEGKNAEVLSVAHAEQKIGVEYRKLRLRFLGIFFFWLSTVFLDGAAMPIV